MYFRNMGLGDIFNLIDALKWIKFRKSKSYGSDYFASVETQK